MLRSSLMAALSLVALICTPAYAGEFAHPSASNSTSEGKVESQVIRKSAPTQHLRKSELELHTESFTTSEQYQIVPREGNSPADKQYSAPLGALYTTSDECA